MRTCDHCARKAEYEFRDSDDDGGNTFWCEEHVGEYLSLQSERIRKIAQAKAQVLFEREVEQVTQAEVQRKRAKELQHQVQRKLVRYDLEVNPGDLLDVVACGCAEGTPRNTIRFGEEWMLCRSCMTLIGVGRVARAVFDHGLNRGSSVTLDIPVLPQDIRAVQSAAPARSTTAAAAILADWYRAKHVRYPQYRPMPQIVYKQVER